MPKNSQPDRSSSPANKILLISLGLAALVWVVFGQCIGHEFINYDDADYVFKNPHIIHGLTIPGLAWAFTAFHAGNWHPLTWISHMLDSHLFGLRPGGHHFTSILLHSITAILLFLVLHRATTHTNHPGSIWRSAFVAALFAIHPLRAESVAWVSERKDVLSALFFVLTLGAYVRYVRKPSAGRYAGVMILFALGLLAKPMLVTVPLLLLIVDFWPLGRLSGADAASFRRIVIEKIPLLFLSAASCVVTWMAQQTAIVPADYYSLPTRIATAVTGVIVYLGQMLWPARLAPFYPYSAKPTLLWPIAAGALIVALTLTFFIRRRREPYLIAGWLWYVLMLIPVIGLVQVGIQSHADRYTYLPQVGVYILIVWAVSDIAARWKNGRRILALAGGLTILILAGLSWRQASFWHDSKRLWTHALAVTSNNGMAEDNLGKVLFEEHDIIGAAKHFEAAVKLRPNSLDVHGDIGNVRFEQGRFDEAIKEFERALSLSPRQPDQKTAELYYDLANAFRRAGRRDKAIENYQRAVQISPDYFQAYYNWGNLVREIGRTDEAIAHYREALRINPKSADAHNNLALALSNRRNIAAAIEQYEEALRADNRSLLALNNLALELATSEDRTRRDPARAVQLAEKARNVSGGTNATILRTLATAYAQNHQFAEAASVIETALPQARSEGDNALAGALQRELSGYKAGLTYDELPP